MMQVLQNSQVVRGVNTLFCLLLLLFSLCGCESRKTIVNALDEKEANEIIVYLSSKGIEAYKVQAPSAGGGGADQKILWNIEVAPQEATTAMSLLNQVGLPRVRGQNLLGIFSNVGLVPSELQEKIRYQAGLGEQIASTIRRIDGVLDAEVQISFPEEDPLNPQANKDKHITASVYVKHSGVLDDPNTHLITKIKRLVQSSVTGLKYDDVTVIPDRARFGSSPYGVLSGIIKDEEKQFVSIWSVVVASESIGRFRIIFFGFIILILLLILTIVWIGWKFYPVIQKQGGVSQLFSLKPYGKVPSKEKKPKKEGEEAEDEEEKEEEKEEPESEEEQMEPEDVSELEDESRANSRYDET